MMWFEIWVEIGIKEIEPVLYFMIKIVFLKNAIICNKKVIFSG